MISELPNAADLPMHVMNIKTHTCIYCNESPVFESFEKYVEHWFAFEYEGDPFHTHEDREEYDWYSAACIG